MKFAEAALFRVAVSPSGKIRDGIRQGRADARFVRGMWLGKTTESDEHLFATDTGVYTTRTVKRVPATEQRRPDLVKSLHGTPWDRLAGRPAGRPRKTAPQAPLVATPPLAKVSVRVKMQTSATVRRRKISILQQSLMSSQFFAQQTPSSSSGPMDTDRGVLETTQPATIAHRAGPAPRSPVEQTDQSAKHNVKPTSRPEQSKSSTSSGIKRDARAAGLPDEDKQGGRFQQVEGLTTVDAAEIPCGFSVKDDLVIDEHAEGVDEEIAKAIVAGKKNELHAMEAFGIFDVCEELPKDAKVTTTRWENVPKGDKWKCRFVTREFRHDDQEMEGLYTLGSRALYEQQQVDWWTCMRHHGHSFLCRDAENSYFHGEEDGEVYCWLPKKEVSRQRWASGKSQVEAEEAALRETESCEEGQRVCRGGNRWSRNRSMSRAAIAVQATRNDADF